MRRDFVFSRTNFLNQKKGKLPRRRFKTTFTQEDDDGGDDDDSVGGVDTQKGNHVPNAGSLIRSALILVGVI